MYIKFKCIECDNTQCDICKIGTYLSHSDLRGCTREVTEEEKAEYLHYINEEIPFLFHYSKEQQQQTWKDIYDCLDRIYAKPISKIISKDGVYS